jgi:hypothetical protein
VVKCHLNNNSLRGKIYNIYTIIYHGFKTLDILLDDTTLFLKLKNGISIALNIIEIFGNLSGLKLNRSKTEGIWLGRLKHCKDKFENL